MPASEYDPESYWKARLNSDFSLRGVGHISYSAGYNRWLYRRKAVALRTALSGVSRTRGRALDVGSGTGWVLRELISLGFQPDGCDIDADSVVRLAAQLPSVTTFVCRLGTDPIPRPDASFDLVTMLDVAYHITDDSLWMAALMELARVIRPGGCIVVSDGLGPSDRSPAPWVHFRSLLRWQTGAAEAGLAVETTGPYFRWLSREQDVPGWRRLPGRVRGPLEYGLECVAPRPAHMQWARLRLRDSVG